MVIAEEAIEAMDGLSVSESSNALHERPDLEGAFTKWGKDISKYADLDFQREVIVNDLQY